MNDQKIQPPDEATIDYVVVLLLSITIACVAGAGIIRKAQPKRELPKRPEQPDQPPPQMARLVCDDCQWHLDFPNRIEYRGEALRLLREHARDKHGRIPSETELDKKEEPEQPQAPPESET